MRRFVTTLFVVVVAGSVALTTGCSKQPSSVEVGTFGLHMTDAPGDFTEVNLVIEEVAAHREGADDASGWEVLSATPGTHDLLKLRNGVFAELALASVPAGHYTQVRLKLGAGSNVVVDGATHPLVIPSGLQSGLKLNGEFDVPAGGGFDLGLDFDAARSIVTTGDGTWTLQPVVRVMPLAAAGAIRGQIWPSDVPADVIASQNGNVTATTEPNADGTFQLSMLQAGTYDVVVQPRVAYQAATSPGVAVAAGATTDIGMIELVPAE